MADVERTRIKLEGVRLSFPDIWVAKAIGDGEPKFSAAFLLDKKAHAGQIKALREKILEMAVTAWPGTKEEPDSKVKELRAAKVKPLRFCLHQGSEKEYDGYDETNMFVSASSNNRPTIVNKDRTPLVKEDGKPYAGCYVDAIIELWVQDNKWGKGINADLRGIQFVKDGEPFGVAPVSPDEFTDYSDEEKPAGKASSDAPATDDNDEIF